MAADAADILARYDRMKSARGVFESHWDEVRRLVYPAGDAFTTRETAGGKSHQTVYDSTPEQAAELLAAALHGLLTNPAIKWFSLRPADPGLARRDDVTRWLAEVRDRMLARLASPRARFAPAQDELYLDLVTYGTGCQFLAEKARFGTCFLTRPLTECFLAEDEDGRVDTVYRRFTYTARQAVLARFAAPGSRVAKAAADPKQADEPFEFVHATYPRADFDPRARTARDMRFASCVVAVDDRVVVAEDGYPEWPWVTPRWRRRAGEVYGRGPGTKVLADVKMLNRGAKVNIQGAERSMSPPLLVADDGVMTQPDLSPQALNVCRADAMRRGEDPIRKIDLGNRPDLGEEFLAAVRERIDQGFFKQLLRVAQDPRMTATQVLELAETTRQVLGPIVGRFEVEDLGPKIDRMFAIEFRAGTFPPPPAALAAEGAELIVDYEGPLAKTQRQSDARAVAQTLEELAGPMAQYDKRVLDVFDFPGAARYVGEVLGWPRQFLRSQDQVEAMASAAGQAADAEAERQAALQTLQVAGKAAPGLAGAAQAAGLLPQPANDRGAAA